MRILVTGVTGSIGAALVPRLKRDGHEVVGFARDPSRVTAPVDRVVQGDALTGEGFREALAGVDVAYYLLHSMERAVNGGFASAELRSVENFLEHAPHRVVYLGGLLPAERDPSLHLGSRLAVEEAILENVYEGFAFRASIVISAQSRSFRFLVRLIERLPVLGLPAWRDNRTAPIDGRDALEFLARAATADNDLSGRSWDIGGPDVMTYGEMMERIADAMMVDRPKIGLGFNLTPIASAVAAAVAGEDTGLIAPLMHSLETDLLLRDQDAAPAFGVRLHRFDAAVERALREWEVHEEVRAR